MGYPIRTVSLPDFATNKMFSLSSQRPISATVSVLLLCSQWFAVVPKVCGCGTDERTEAAVSCCGVNSQADRPETKHSCCSVEESPKECTCGASCGDSLSQCVCGCSADEQEPIRNSNGDESTRSPERVISPICTYALTVDSDRSTCQLRRRSVTSLADHRSAQVLLCVWRI